MPTVRTPKKRKAPVSAGRPASARVAAGRPATHEPKHDVRLTYYITRDMNDALRKRKGAKKIGSYLAERERLLQAYDLH